MLYFTNKKLRLVDKFVNYLKKFMVYLGGTVSSPLEVTTPEKMNEKMPAKMSA